jgi:hypothetical protein
MPEPETYQDPPGAQPEGRSGLPPVHPLSALLLLVVDNLWNLGDWAIFAWVIIIPLSFMSVFFPGLFLQRYANHDSWGKSIGKALMLGVLAAVPTSIAGTPIGVAFLAWAGLDRWRSRKDILTNPIAALSGQPAPAPSAPSTGQPGTARPVIDVQEGAATPCRSSEPNFVAAASSPSSPPPSVQPHYEPLLPPPHKASKIGVLALCLVMVALCFGGVVYLMEFATERVESWAEKAGKLVGFFRRPPLTESFVASLPELSRTEGGELHIASLKSNEQVSQTDYRFKFFEVESSIRVPVTYQYFIRLRDDWELNVTNGICWVNAPKVRPNLPIIHTDKMHKEKDFAASQEMLDDLEKTLTPRFWLNGLRPEYLKLVREDCRKTVGEFVRDWILSQDRWKDYNIHTVKIVFPEEVGSEEAKMLPTLMIDKD